MVQGGAVQILIIIRFTVVKNKQKSGEILMLMKDSCYNAIRFDIA